jgi:uncharacterized membrane protein YGL010W
MSEFFRRRLASYAQHHRDERNSATHYIGIPMILLAVLIPLAFWSVSMGVLQISIGTLLLAFAAVGWIALDAGVGFAMLVMIVPLAAAAEWIVRSGSAARALWIAAALFVAGWIFQFVGHSVFEKRKPAFFDDLAQLFIGPMFIVAKSLVLFGFRRDLAAVLNGAGEAMTPRPARN